MAALRTVYRYWAALVFLAVVAQIAAAGYGGFYSSEKLEDQPGEDEERHLISEETFETGFDFHTGFGYIIFYASVLLFLLALAARVGRPRVWWNLALPLALVVQITVLGWAAHDVPFLGALHGFWALVILALSGSLALTAWRDRVQPARAAVSP